MKWCLSKFIRVTSLEQDVDSYSNVDSAKSSLFLGPISKQISYTNNIYSMLLAMTEMTFVNIHVLDNIILKTYNAVTAWKEFHNVFQWEKNELIIKSTMIRKKTRVHLNQTIYCIYQFINQKLFMRLFLNFLLAYWFVIIYLTTRTF